ncbi:MAG: hypothetical protein OEV08_07410 [Nitrospira sp.]|nr:hypothetical protein [Nitrospira sp.]
MNLLESRNSLLGEISADEIPYMKQEKLPIENLSCHQSLLEHFLLPILRGNVFHLTNRSGLMGITKDALIRSNKNGESPFTYPQSARSYARARGYVSLFDLRTTTDVQLERALSNYYFLNPSFTSNNPNFLIISEALYPALIPWTKARDEDAWKEMFIPYVEAFHQGDIPISSISRVVSVKIKQVKKRKNSLSGLMDKAFQELCKP